MNFNLDIIFIMTLFKINVIPNYFFNYVYKKEFLLFLLKVEDQ